MKRIQYVSEIPMEDGSGDSYFRVPGTDNVTTVGVLRIAGPDGKVEERKLEPWVQRQYAFLLLRTADAECVKHITDAIEAELFRVELRTALKQQKEFAATRGYWELDDAHALAILNATTKPTTPLGNGPIFNYVPFIRAVKDMTTPEAKSEPAVTTPANGAAAQA